MVDKSLTVDATVPDTGAPGAPIPPRRPPGHRSTDVRDTVAEMAARAQEISQEAGSKVAAAMKDVIGAAAGLAGFAIESARDLVQYMVRRGQMTQEEADKLMREAEEAYAKKKPPASRIADAPKPVAKAAEPRETRESRQPRESVGTKRAAPPAAKKSVKHPAKKSSKPTSAAARSRSKPVAKKRK